MRCRYARRKGTSNERWKVYLYHSGRKWVRYSYEENVPLSSEFLAQRLCHAINSEIERLGPGFAPKAWFKPSGHELRFDNYSKAWLERKARDLAPSTYGSWHGILKRYLVPALGALDIRSIKRGHLEDYLAKLPTTLADKTKEAHLGIIRAILKDAFKREETLRVPPIPTIKVTSREIKWLSVDQQDAVLDAIPQEHQPIFRFLCFYGLRPAEARALQWDAIDWDKKAITIKRSFSGPVLRATTKSHVIRQLPMMPEIEELLRGIRGLGGFVFRTDRAGPYPHCRLTRIWKAAVKKSKVSPVELYQGIRHSRAMQCLSAGWDFEQIRGLLGHADQRTTKRYAKADVNTLRSQFERVPSRLPNPKGKTE